MHGDFLLGNNFISNYLPMQIHYKFVALTLKKELVDISLLEQHKYKCLSDFTPTKRGESHTKALELISTLDSSIYVAPENFIIRTDNKAVKDFLTYKRNIIEGRRLKWYNAIANYSFEVEFIKGTNNFIADYLSRNHNEELLNKQLIEIKFLQESMDPPK
jgi:hypothetical protein